ELNIITYVRNKYNQIHKKHPDVIDRIEKLPNRVKTSKKFKDANVNVLRKKGLSLFAQQAETIEDPKVESLTFENFLQFIECEYGTKRVPMTENFWPVY